MRILITGGAGFIGSHLIDWLLRNGHEAVCVDNLFTGSRENIKPFLQNSSFTFIEHDIIHPLDLEKYLGEGVQIDHVYNLACPASPIHYQENPVRTIKANTIGVINMLGLARKHGARFLQASTSEVYGDPTEHPQREEYRGNVNPVGPRACYDEGKRCAETLSFDYYRMHGMEIKVVRIFNTYGPRMTLNDGRVVSNFIIQALRGDDITIYGDGTQTRSFAYVDDLVDGMVRMMQSDPSFHGPVNLGNPNECTVVELAHMILAMTGSKSRIVYRGLPPDDPTRRCPDISLAKKELGWSPTVSLIDGLKKTISDFRSRI